MSLQFFLLSTAFAASILLIPASALACSCAPSTLENSYCNSDWVATGKVTHHIDQVEKTENGGEVVVTRYVLQYGQIFKVSDQMLSTAQNQVMVPNSIYTSNSAASCGLSLELGKIYLLTGDFSNGKSSVNLCQQFDTGLGMLWENVPFGLREKLEMRQLDEACKNHTKAQSMTVVG